MAFMIEKDFLEDYPTVTIDVPFILTVLPCEIMSAAYTQVIPDQTYEIYGYALTIPNLDSLEFQPACDYSSSFSFSVSSNPDFTQFDANMIKTSNPSTDTVEV